jgi:hypothetical protein
MKSKQEPDIKIRAAEIERLLAEFKTKFKAGTSDVENFMTMNEIEHMWSELRTDTDNVYSDMLREMMSTIDESELIRKKKENTKQKELD